MNILINELLDFGLLKKMITKEDVAYSANLLLDLFLLDDFQRVETNKVFESQCIETLEAMLDFAVEKGIIENTITQRDLFDTKIMNCIMPRPSEVIQKFDNLYQENKKAATDYFYDLSIASNYIRKTRTDKNIFFQKDVHYGALDISINLSKPEKDPKEIAAAKNAVHTNYPKCLLCKENVGYMGDMNRNARQTHRIIPLKLDQQKYYLQYSPYVYYNEHCIIFNDEHIPMVINKKTFKNLISFLDVFPHYMIGSNADLPIVGGSILSHDHYQGGNYTFPIQNAKNICAMNIPGYDDVTVNLVAWPMSTIRITSSNSKKIIKLADLILTKWIDYSDAKNQIISHTNGTRHNTVTPIARMHDGLYQMDIVLRNNRCDAEHPDGIFHPHQDVHHIKKENIGLIEVMGLAILPPRLKTSLELLADCLLGVKSISDYPELSIHHDWIQEINQKHEINQATVKDILEQELALVFERVLSDAGVFKLDEKGISGFKKFIEKLGE